MLLESLLPYLPSTPAELFIYIGASLCIILMTYAVFVEQEHRQDIMRLLGTGGLFWYAVYIENVIFAVAMAAIGLASLIEFVEIMLGLHKHGPEDLKKYKMMWRVGKNK